MNVRFVVVSLLVMLWSGCTCAGCEKKVDAPPAPAVMDASVPVAKIDAPVDAGERLLPYEVTMNVPPDAVLIERYAADCHLALRARYDDMDGEAEKPECEAIATDQNCAPDVFGCWDQQTECTNGCAAPCNACEQACATSCDACKTGGKDAKACGAARLACRNECLYAQMACRSACAREAERCSDLGEERIKQQCPDCDAINQCLWDRANDGPEKRATCLKPGNARECLEWCFAE